MNTKKLSLLLVAVMALSNSVILAPRTKTDASQAADPVASAAPAPKKGWWCCSGSSVIDDVVPVIEMTLEGIEKAWMINPKMDRAEFIKILLQSSEDAVMIRAAESTWTAQAQLKSSAKDWDFLLNIANLTPPVLPRHLTGHFLEKKPLLNGQHT